MNRKRLMVVAVVAVLVGSVYVYRMITRAHEGIANIEPVAELRAGDLVLAFVTNEGEANRQYLGKVIQVDGSIREILSRSPELNVLIASDENGYVQCAFQSSSDEMEIGMPITVKGKCSGYLMDVILIDCVAIQN